MNDSNNNLFGNNVTSTSQPEPQTNNTTSINSTSEINNTINNANSTTNSNNAFDINSTSAPLQNETYPTHQNITSIQQQKDFSQQMNNAMNSNINSFTSSTANPTSTNNVNEQSTMQTIQNINTLPQQDYILDNHANDDELLRAFIGNNYDKITTKSFNFAGFFFTSFYMFYRKMFLYGFLLFLVNLIVLNVINFSIVIILFGIVTGFFVNKVYLYYAKKKITKIKLENPQKSIEELKEICSTKGGTSVGKFFLGLFTELVITLLVLIVMLIVGIGGIIVEFFNLDNWNIKVNDKDKPSSEGILAEDVIVSGYSCIGSKCNVSIEEANQTTDYELNVDNSELIKALGDYSNYIKVNIYYTQKGEEKTIVDYKVFLKSSNEDISNIKTENELRDKIGLYSIGTHTETLTLTRIGTTGGGFKDNTSYIYTTYTFVDNKNIEYEMEYINPNSTLNLTEGNKYSVTFEVAEDTFGYEFNIKTIKYIYNQ